jgi:hypothetical protein
MKTSYEDFFRDIVITIHMNIRELNERKNFADPEELDHISTKLLTYEEVLSILRDSANEFKIPKEEFGL